MAATAGRNKELPAVSVAEIDRAIQSRIHTKQLSAAVCVASVGERIFHRACYGSLTMPPPIRRFGFDALFDLGSLSKPLGAGLAAFYLVSRGRLDLHANVSQIIKPLAHGAWAQVTVDMLLDHTSGLPANVDLWREVVAADARRAAGRKVLGTPKARADMEAALAKVVFAHPPGAHEQYSSVGFLLLGWVLEAVTGKPLDAFLQQEVYRPLAVDDLFFVRQGDYHQGRRMRSRAFAASAECPWRERLLQGEVHDANAWCLGGVAGQAGLFGTGDAVWRLALNLLDSFHGRATGWFHTATLQRFWTRSRRVADSRHALGWEIPVAQGGAAGKRFSRTSVGHTGSVGTALWIDPAHERIGVLLTNAIHPTPEGKPAMLAELWPRVFDLIASCGDEAPQGRTRRRR